MIKCDDLCIVHITFIMCTILYGQFNDICYAHACAKYSHILTFSMKIVLSCHRLTFTNCLLSFSSSTVHHFSSSDCGLFCVTFHDIKCLSSKYIYSLCIIKKLLIEIQNTIVLKINKATFYIMMTLSFLHILAVILYSQLSSQVTL